MLSQLSLVSNVVFIMWQTPAAQVHPSWSGRTATFDTSLLPGAPIKTQQAPHHHHSTHKARQLIRAHIA